MQSLDFFEESAFFRLKIAQSKGQDVIMQRYIPAKSNNNSIVRVVWQRAPDEKHSSNTNAGGFFKVIQLLLKLIRCLWLRQANSTMELFLQTSFHPKKGSMTSIDSLILDFLPSQRGKLMTTVTRQRKR